MCLHTSLLINVVDGWAEGKGDCVLVVDGTNGKWRSEVCWWLGWGASVFPTPARSGCDIEGISPSSVSSLLVLWGRSVINSWFISHHIFPVTVHLPVPLPSLWVMLSTFLYCLEFTAGNYLLIKHCIGGFLIEVQPLPASWGGLTRTKQWQTIAFWPNLLMMP